MINYNGLNSRFEKLIGDIDKFRYQLMAIVGGVLAVFVAINGNNNIANLIKYGFLLLGASLIFGIASIVLDLSDSSLELWFEFRDDILPNISKKLDLIKEEDIEKMDSQAREEFINMKCDLDNTIKLYIEPERGKFTKNGINILRKHSKSGYFDLYPKKWTLEKVHFFCVQNRAMINQ